MSTEQPALPEAWKPQSPPAREMTPVQDVEIEKYLVECVQLEPLAIQEEFVRLPGDFAYWSERYRQALISLADTELLYKQTKARLQRTHRERLLANGKATEAMVEAAVDEDKEYAQAYRARAVAEAEKEAARLSVEAIRVKKEALISLGATVRQELENDPVIRQRVAMSKAAANPPF